MKYAALIAIVVLAAISACGADRSGFVDNHGTLDTDAAAPDGGGACFHCSPDLKTVFKGCAGETATVVATCTADQGCGIDSCVGACESAALNKGSVGCSFSTVQPDTAHDDRNGSCFAAMIANTWDRPVQITAEYGATPLDVSKSLYMVTQTGTLPHYEPLTGPLLPGQVALAFLSDDPSNTGQFAVRCPGGVTPAMVSPSNQNGTIRTKAFHLMTDAPVAAYSMYPYGGAQSYIPSATLLLPQTSWSGDYVAVSSGLLGPSPADTNTTSQIIASEDDTTVSMRATADIAAGAGVEPSLKGAVGTWTLAKGEVLQITQNAALSGSAISADKPIGVFGGSPCTVLPQYGALGPNTNQMNCCCDTTQQQIAPFSQWGNRYSLVPYPSRISSATQSIREKVLWSFVGAASGTTLTYDPSAPPGAPSALGAGEVVTFLTDGITSVRSQDSQHPFHVAVYMTSALYDGGIPPIDSGLPESGKVTGDPDFVTVVPIDQYLDHYVFFVDFTFPESSLTVVRKKTDGAFQPVALDCGGEISGFMPLGDELEYAWVTLTSGSVAQGACGYGRHEAKSKGVFSITVWGTGEYASYGYAAGRGTRVVNDAPPPLVR